MLMVGVIKYHKEPPTHKFAWLFNKVVMWGHITNTLYLHLQKTNGRQGADLEWEVPIRKATLSFNHVTNVKSRDNLKNLCFHYHKTYGQQTWQGASLWVEDENSNIKNLFKALTNKTVIKIKNIIYLVYNRDPVIVLRFFRQSRQ